MSLEAYYSRPREQRIAIVGANIIHPAGNSLAQYWQNVCAGKIFITAQTISLADRESIYYVGEVSNFDVLAYMGGKQLKKADRYAEFTIGAGIPALLESGILTQKNTPSRTEEAIYKLHKVKPERAGIEIGIAAGGTRATEQAAADIIRRGFPSPRTIPYINLAKGATELGRIANFTGRQATHNLACSSGNASYEEGADRIKLGKADLVVVGGTDAVKHKVTFDAFSLIKVLAKCDPDNLYDDQGNWINPSRPLSNDSMGLVIGEGAAVGILTRLDYALDVGLPIIAELAGMYSFTDPKDELEPEPENVARLIRGTLIDANLDPEDVDGMVTHTAGTIGDKREIEGAKQIFRDHAPNVTIRPSKLNGGHLMGGAGAVGMVDGIQAVRTNTMPPIPYGNLIDSLGFDFPQTLREKIINVVVVNSLGLDGQYAGAAVVSSEKDYRAQAA